MGRRSSSSDLEHPDRLRLDHGGNRHGLDHRRHDRRHLGDPPPLEGAGLPCVGFLHRIRGLPDHGDLDRTTAPERSEARRRPVDIELPVRSRGCCDRALRRSRDPDLIAYPQPRHPDRGVGDRGDDRRQRGRLSCVSRAPPPDRCLRRRRARDRRPPLRDPGDTCRRCRLPSPGQGSDRRSGVRARTGDPRA